MLKDAVPSVLASLSHLLASLALGEASSHAEPTAMCGNLEVGPRGPAKPSEETTAPAVSLAEASRETLSQSHPAWPHQGS